MRGLIVEAGKADSARLVDDLPEPDPAEGSVLVDGLALGICGTDREIATGQYGWAPPGEDRLILGHESLGRVREAAPGSGFTPGDLVVGIVRRPDPVPCPNCAAGEFDMCRNGQYTEHGIKGLHGFAREFSIQAGNTQSFSCHGTTASAIDIYRVGYYGGSGARLVTTIVNTGATQSNPATISSRRMAIGGTRPSGSHSGS